MMAKRRFLLPPDINWKKLKLELTVVIIVALAVTAIQIGPWLMAQPVPQFTDSYASYKRLYNDVISYNYSRGADDKLEERIYKAVNTVTNNNTYHYFQVKAAIEYYSRLGAYRVLPELVENARSYAPDGDEYEYLREIEETYLVKQP